MEALGVIVRDPEPPGVPRDEWLAVTSEDLRLRASPPDSHHVCIFDAPVGSLVWDRGSIRVSGPSPLIGPIAHELAARVGGRFETFAELETRAERALPLGAALIFVLEVGLATAGATVLAFVSSFSAGFGMRALEWEGPVTPLSVEERAELALLRDQTFALAFDGLLLIQAVVTAVVLSGIRAGQRSLRQRPAPISVTLVQAGFAVLLAESLVLWVWTAEFGADVAAVDVAYGRWAATALCAIVGLWLSTLPARASRHAAAAAALAICAVNALAASADPRFIWSAAPFVAAGAALALIVRT